VEYDTPNPINAANANTLAIINKSVVDNVGGGTAGGLGVGDGLGVGLGGGDGGGLGLGGVGSRQQHVVPIGVLGWQLYPKHVPFCCVHSLVFMQTVPLGHGTGEGLGLGEGDGMGGEGLGEGLGLGLGDGLGEGDGMVGGDGVVTTISMVWLHTSWLPIEPVM
jgi:hypothetical protein